MFFIEQLMGGLEPRFDEEYAELRANRLAKRNAEGVMQITGDGETALRVRFELD